MFMISGYQLYCTIKDASCNNYSLVMSFATGDCIWKLNIEDLIQAAATQHDKVDSFLPPLKNINAQINL